VSKDNETIPTLFAVGTDHLLVNGETGEVIGIPDAPPAVIEDTESILGWYGPRRRRIEAKRDGLTAERDALLKQIREHYDPLIKEQESALKWLALRYEGILRAYATGVVGQLEKAKSFKRHLVTLGFRTKTEHFEVKDEAAAIDWARENCPEAVKVKESFLVSQLTDEAKILLRQDAAASGIEPIPAHEEFYVR
jgi:hypothetical protein